MNRSIAIDAKLAPLPAMRAAIHLIEEAGFPRHEKTSDALRVLRAAVSQAEFAADRKDNGPTEREIIRGILGADVEP